MSQDIRTIRIATQGPAGPAGSQVFSVGSQAAMLALTAHQGDIAVRADIDASFALAAADPSMLANWTELLSAGGGGGGGAVSSVAGRTGDVTLGAGDIAGLAASATTDATDAGNITAGTLSNARLSGVALTANNLSDLADAATARASLGLGTLAVLGAGAGFSSGGGNLSADVTLVAGRTGAVTLAAGDVSGLAASATTDTTNAANISAGTLSNSRLSGIALAANNLSDLANAGTARTNLGLGSLATLGVGSGLTSGAGNLSANVTSVAGRTGAVTIAQADVAGLTTTDTPSFKVLTLTGAANAALITGSGYSLTGSDAHSLVDYSGTINTTGVPDVIALRISDTAHGTNTKLLNLYAGSTGTTSKFSVTTAGAVTAASGVVAASFNTAGDASGYLQFGSKAYLNGSVTDGVMTLLDNGATGNVRFQFGGATSSFPALKRNGTALDVRLADDTGYAALNVAAVSGTSWVGSSAIVAGASSSISWSGRTKLTSGADGSLTVQNNGGTNAHTLSVAANAALNFGGPAVLKGYTAAALPSGSAGMMAYVTDGDAALAWGATIVNSGAGATPYHVWHNGTNWTVVGK
jgi:hypothetical protein